MVGWTGNEVRCAPQSEEPPSPMVSSKYMTEVLLFGLYADRRRYVQKKALTYGDDHGLLPEKVFKSDLRHKIAKHTIDGRTRKPEA
jgi:hypothetical protein